MNQRNAPPLPPPLPPSGPSDPRSANAGPQGASGYPASNPAGYRQGEAEEVDLEPDQDSAPTSFASPGREAQEPVNVASLRQGLRIPTPTAAMSLSELQAQAAARAASRGTPAPPAAMPSTPPAMGAPGSVPMPGPHTPPQGYSGFAPMSYGTPPISGAQPAAQQTHSHSIALRADFPREVRPAASHVVRSRAYAFVLDARGMPIEIGSGRFAKAFLGEERWLESKTDFRRHVVIKLLQRGVTDDDRMRFQIEKELLERVQGSPNIITLYASGESDDPEFIPPYIRDKVENDFVILERLDMSLEERLKGSRIRGKREDLLALNMRDRLFRVLDYMIPIASAVEYAHLVRNVCHRDIKPANILIGLPDPNLRGSSMEVRLADFNVAKVEDDEVSFGMTQMKTVPGTLFFQSPEQETNVIEVLVNVAQGSPEVEYFEDFYIQIAKNDSFSLFNRGELYTVLYTDRAKKRIVLDRPYRDTSEVNVRAKIVKSVGRPADIYSLGALFYYLISGAYANPKTLYDAFHKFIEYEQTDEKNSIEGYLEHEYTVIHSLRAPKTDEQGVNVAPADRFFTYKHYLDGNGELIDGNVMRIIARCMIRNKPDSYCQPHELETTGISVLVQDLLDLYTLYGYQPSAGSSLLARRGHHGVSRSRFMRSLGRVGSRMRQAWMMLLGALGIRRR